ncbi:MAG: hypothetical protein GF315_14850 [candidate division Zixibacteria bacterium]|nr:hypothetical protein [candidate division Zixibacteria bacterium]
MACYHKMLIPAVGGTFLCCWVQSRNSICRREIRFPPESSELIAGGKI